MDFSSLDLSKKYTYADYLTWQFKERLEIFKGKIAKMTPAPSSYHQGITGNILYDLLNIVKKKKKKHRCKIFTAPFDVRLPLYNEKNDEEITTVVQPDISVICDTSKIDKRGCLGAPDIIIEVLSKSTAPKDVKIKFKLYEESGVKEYWIVSPGEHVVTVWKLDNKGKYSNSKMYSEEDILKTDIIEDLQIRLKDIFEF